MSVGNSVVNSSVVFGDEPVGLRERQRLARVDAILEAAFALIVDKGYDALTMEEVASRVGISRQTLYYHFNSREEIMLRAILKLMDQGIAMIESIVPTHQPLDRLKSIVRWLLETRFKPNYAALVKVRYSLISIKSHPDYKIAFERRAIALSDVVTAAQVAGELRNDLPSRLIVQMMLGLVSDASYEGLIESGITTPNQVIDSIIKVFFAGLCP